jgi:hypothetical protein
MFLDPTDVLGDDFLEFPGPRQSPIGALDGKHELRSVFFKIMAGRYLEHLLRFYPGLETETGEQGLLDAQAQGEAVEVVLGNDDRTRKERQAHLEGRDLAQPCVRAAEP